MVVLLFSKEVVLGEFLQCYYACKSRSVSSAVMQTSSRKKWHHGAPRVVYIE
jgi:hypothetical protein